MPSALEMNARMPKACPAVHRWWTALAVVATVVVVVIVIDGLWAAARGDYGDVILAPVALLVWFGLVIKALRRT